MDRRRLAVEGMTRSGAHDDFSKDNKPHGKRDFGAFEVAGHRLCWKSDYYDLCRACPDPADPALTRRVLTLMQAEED